MSTHATVFIASDHAGFELKEHLIRTFSELEWADLGPYNDDRVDYPHFANLVADQVNLGKGIGVLVCGSGQGMAMRANKFPLVRAALCWNTEVAQLAREHNDANILCLGQRITGLEDGERILKVFLETPFAGGRHENRVKKICQPFKEHPHES